MIGTNIKIEKVDHFSQPQPVHKVSRRPSEDEGKGEHKTGPLAP